MSGSKRGLRKNLIGSTGWSFPVDIVTPGWSDPRVDKLPHFGLPADMTGMRVLDIGNAEGFFSFEAERRGAAEVVGLENYPANGQEI